MTTLIPKFQRTGTGAVNRAFNFKLAEVVSVMDFGAVGDGTTDDTASIQAAYDYLASVGGGTLHIPYTTTGYKFSSLTFNADYTKVIGDGFVTLTSTAASGSAIVVGKTANFMYGFSLEGITLVGNATADVGLECKGDDTANVLAGFSLNNIYISGFTKATATTAKFRFAIEGLITNCQFDNGYYAATVTGLCTVLKFINTRFRAASFGGLYTETGCVDINFDTCVFESNYGPGVYMHGGIVINFDNCWWENNNRASQAVTANSNFNYNFVCDTAPGSGSGNGPCNLRNCYFNSGAAFNEGDINTYNASGLYVTNTTTWTTTYFVNENAASYIGDFWYRFSNITYKGSSTQSIIGVKVLSNLGAILISVTASLANSSNVAINRGGTFIFRNATTLTTATYWLDPVKLEVTFISGDVTKWNLVGGAGFLSVQYFIGEFRIVNESGGAAIVQYSTAPTVAFYA